MSTNKRREAALFELIDKSTLKVPKSGGSLKIPSWWASKQANSVEQDSNPIVPPAAAAGPSAAANGSGGGPQGGIEPVVQQKLFDPPPSNVKPSVSASIRPPGKPVAASAVVRTPVVRGSVVPATAPSGSVPAGSRVNGPAKVREFRREVAPAASAAVSAPATRQAVEEPVEVESRRTFAPMTAGAEAGNGTGGGWAGPHSGRMPRVPTWAMVATGAGILVLVVCLLMVFTGPGKSKAATPGGAVPGANTDNGPGIIPSPPGPGGRGGSRGPAAGGGAGNGNVRGMTPGQVGRVFPVGTVPHSPQLYYLWIAQTPEKQIAERNAKFIAEHGVDVSVETRMQNGQMWYVVLSVEGFPTVQAGDEFRQAVVKIGHEFPPELKIKRAWDDAIFQRVKPGSGR